MIGPRLRELRLTAEPRVTIRSLAALAGVSPTTIWNVEKGKADCSIGRAKKLADALGVPLVALLDHCPGSRGELRCTLSAGHPDPDHYDHRRRLSWRDGDAR